MLIETRVSGMIPDSAIPDGGARSLVMADVRRIAEGLDAVLAQGGLDESELSDMRADFTNVRTRLAEVGVALGGEVPTGSVRGRQDLPAGTPRPATRC